MTRQTLDGRQWTDRHKDISRECMWICVIIREEITEAGEDLVWRREFTDQLQQRPHVHIQPYVQALPVRLLS